MTPCLLCPAPAVADGLCVEDGARLWAAGRRLFDAAIVDRLTGHVAPHSAREGALCAIPTPDAARAFLARLEEARASRPACSRKGCPGGPDHA